MDSRLSCAAQAIQNTQLELSKLLSDAKFENEVKESEEDVRPKNIRSIKPKSRSNAVFIELNRRLIRAQEEIKELRRENQEVTNTRDAALAKIAMEKKESETLRAILEENMRTVEQYKYKMKQSQKFYDSLGGISNDPERLLKFSEPPASFAGLKLTVQHATELENTKVKLRIAEAEVQKLTVRIQNVNEQLINTKTSRRNRMKEAEQLVRSKHKQVLGAVRRIHYLVDSNEKMQLEMRKKDEYISKIEAKLLDCNKAINTKTLVLPKKQYVHEISAANTVNWDSVFKQCKLDRPPPSLLSSQLSTTSTRKSSEDDVLLNEKYSEWASDPLDRSSIDIKTPKKSSAFERMLEDEAFSPGSVSDSFLDRLGSFQLDE